MASAISEPLHAGNGNGHGWASWIKLLLTLGTAAVTVGGLLYGMLSGFWKIDERMVKQDERLDRLTTAFERMADKGATLEAVDNKIQVACLQMAIVNKGRFECPFSMGGAAAPSIVKPVVKRVTVKQIVK